jgi:hypothetical protein
MRFISTLLALVVVHRVVVGTTFAGSGHNIA